MRGKMVACLAAAALALAGCASQTPNQDTGLVAGAVAGGLIGNQFGKGKGNVLATAAGIVAGGIIGSEIGRSMDEQDRLLAQEAEYDALERGNSGAPRRWRNDRNGRYGEFVPTKPYRRSGRDCRDYTHKVWIDDRPRTMRGTACRTPDGTWENVS